MTYSYDPFRRGAHPVAVRTESWTDQSRGRTLPVEVWYPADVSCAGHDLDPSRQDRFEQIWTTRDQANDREPTPARQAAVRDGAPAALPGPFVLFSHGYAGHRREATFLCTHLASHGYVVASADHLGSTSWEVDDDLAADTPPNRQDHRHDMAVARKGDVPFLVAEATRRGYAADGRVGVTGISLGGWTTLISPTVESRVAAIAPMCPAGGSSPIAPGRNALAEALDLAWSREVPCLHMVADRDAWLPLYGQLEVFSKLPGPARMVILLDADHNHFVDDIPTSHTWYRELTLTLAEVYGNSDANWAAIAQSILPIEDLVDPEAASSLWRGLTVAHFDAHLRESADARELLDNRLSHEARRLGATALTIKGDR